MTTHRTTSTLMTRGDFTLSVDPDLFNTVPTYTRTVITCDIADARTGQQVVSDYLSEAIKSAADSLTGYTSETINQHPDIQLWRAAFKSVGINPSKFRPSIDALLRRAARSHDLRFGNTLIDLGTALSLHAGRPVGMHTLDDPQFKGVADLRLGFARGDEKFTDFAGETETAEPNELIYTLGPVVLTRRWVWRQGRVGSISSTSHRLAINIDSLTNDAADVVDVATQLLDACGATRLATHRLDSSNCHAQVKA